ncbi:MAG: hypothetical protein N4A70_10735 [Pelagimonas sp.]|jgi:hypothetical protein|nr:hypothetical protein [Pelagimonas sp.]
MRVLELTGAVSVSAQNPQVPLDEVQVRRGRLFDWAAAQELTGWQPIRRIEIWDGTTKAALRRLMAVEGLEDLFLLDLRPHGKLAGMPLPRSLWRLHCDFLSSRDVQALARLPGLQELWSHYAGMSEKTIEALLAMPTLTHLELEGAGLNDDLAERLAQAQGVTHLDIGATQVGARGLRAICKMTQLTELDIWALPIEDADLGLLTSLPHLEYLSLGNVFDQPGLTAEGVMAILPELPALKRLWLDGVAMPEVDLAALGERLEHVQVS